MTNPDNVAAWQELHAANALLGWFVGPPEQRYGGRWEIYAFDQTENARIGERSREWTAVDNTEAACIRAMARCLREITEERVPK